MASLETHVLSGIAFWAKVVGKPVANYNKDGFEWSIDVSLNAEQKKLAVGLGLKDKIKNKGNEQGDFIQFKRSSVKRGGDKKGEPNDPIKIVTADGKTQWDRDILIGNGTEVRVKFVLNETVNQRTKKKGLRPDPLAIQVVKLVPYAGGGGAEFDAVEGAEEAAASDDKDW